MLQNICEAAVCQYIFISVFAPCLSFVSDVFSLVVWIKVITKMCDKQPANHNSSVEELSKLLYVVNGVQANMVQTFLFDHLDVRCYFVNEDNIQLV